MQVTVTDIMVLCSFDTSVVLGYSVMVQTIGSFNVMSNESRDKSPVGFEGLNSGPHIVTVFPLTDRGIIGTTVVYTELVMVIPPTTSTIPRTTLSTTAAVAGK